MKFQEQLIKDHNPEINLIGDCYRTCVAILLNMRAEDVPHFSELAHFMGEGFGQADELAREWLEKQGYRVMSINYADFDGVDEHIAKATGGMPYILTAQSPNFPGVAHCCIAQNGTQVIWDPSCGYARDMKPYRDPESGVKMWFLEIIVRSI